MFNSWIHVSFSDDRSFTRKKYFQCVLFFILCPLLLTSQLFNLLSRIMEITIGITNNNRRNVIIILKLFLGKQLHDLEWENFCDFRLDLKVVKEGSQFIIFRCSSIEKGYGIVFIFLKHIHFLRTLNLFDSTHIQWTLISKHELQIRYYEKTPTQVPSAKFTIHSYSYQDALLILITIFWAYF